MQTAPAEDKIYYVPEGRARLKACEAEHAIQKGTLMYAQTAWDHTFFHVEKGPTVLAFFGTASRRTYIRDCKSFC